MKYKLITLFLISIFSFNLISCTANDANKKVDESIKVEQDNNEKDDVKEKKMKNNNVFLALKENKDSLNFELLAKFKDDKNFNEIGGGSDPFSITYSDSLDRIFFVDENGTIRTKGKSDSKDYGVNSTGSYRRGAGYKMWSLGVSYKMPKDKSYLVYTNKDRELVFVNSNGTQKIIGKNVGFKDDESGKYINERFFKISNDGKYIFFNDDSSLVSYNVELGEMQDIDSYVERFEISENGRYIAYTFREQSGFVIKDLEKNISKKYDEFSTQNVWDMKVFDNGSAVIMSDIEEDMMWGFVTYIDNEGKKHKIPNRVICYEIFKGTEYVQIIDGFMYYIDGSYKLCKYDINSAAIEVIDINVNDFEIIENDIYYAQNNGQVWVQKDMKNKKNIIEEQNNLDNYSYIEKLDDKNVLIKTGNSDIYINEKFIADDIEGYAFYIDRLAYYKTNGEVYTIRMENKISNLEFKDYKEFDCLYYGNNILYASEKLNGL